MAACLKLSITIVSILTVTQIASATSPAQKSTQFCNHMSINTCMLPFPSNQYTVTNSSSPTGLKIDLKGSLFPKHIEDEQPIKSTDIYNGKNGFSAAAPVLFELSEPYNKNALPADGGNAFIVYNRDTGQRESIHTGQVKLAANKTFFGSSATTVVEAYPRSRFQFNTNYVAVITKNLTTQDGGQYNATPAVTALINGTASNAVNEVYKDAFNYIVAKGIAADQIVSLTTFTIIDEHGNNNDYFKLVDIVENDEHPVRNLETTHRLIGSVAVVVKGQLRLTDLRDEISGAVKYKPGIKGRTLWTDFVLEIPKAAEHKKVPVAIYGHGFGSSKFNAILTGTSFVNARNGIATISIDKPYHGSRATKECDGDGEKHISCLIEKGELVKFAGMLTQSSLDLESVKAALQTSLANIDAVSSPSQGVGIPDLDIDQIIYEGTSLGGILGSTFVSTARGLKGGFMQVAGIGFANILQNALFFELGVPYFNAIPKHATGGDASLFFHAVQTEVDISDGINFAHYSRKGGYGRSPRPTAFQYGLGDSIISNRSSEVYAEILNAPLVGKTYHDVPHLRKSESFEDGGYGVIQTLPLFNITSPDFTLPGIRGHLSVIKPEVRDQMKNWFRVVTE